MPFRLSPQPQTYFWCIYSQRMCLMGRDGCKCRLITLNEISWSVLTPRYLRPCLSIARLCKRNTVTHTHCCGNHWTRALKRFWVRLPAGRCYVTTLGEFTPLCLGDFCIVAKTDSVTTVADPEGRRGRSSCPRNIVNMSAYFDHNITVRIKCRQGRQ